MTDAGAGGGGGSGAVYSLDPDSPSLVPLFGPADLLLDDPFTDGILTLGIAAAGLDLGPSDDIDALSGGTDNGVLVMIGEGLKLFTNPMIHPAVFYQFSVDRDAVNGVTGPVPLPFVPPGLLVIETTDDYTAAFPFAQNNINTNQDAFAVTPPFYARSNFIALLDDDLELMNEGATVDNIDAFTSVGAIGGGPDADFDGFLDVGVRVYFSLAGPADGATIYVKDGPAPLAVYATAEALGLVPEDDIDGVSIWDSDPKSGGADLVFGPGDGVVFSLTPESPSLATLTFDGLTFDGGAVFLAVPGMGIIHALPGEFFALSDGSAGSGKGEPDNLDEVNCIDPRAGTPPCPFYTGRTVVPAEAVVASRTLIELPVGAIDGVWVAFNDTTTFDDLVNTISVTATIVGGSGSAGVIASESFLCGGPEGDCCGGCGGMDEPPCGIESSFFGCALCTAFTDYDACVGAFMVEAFFPGTTRMILSAGVDAGCGAAAGLYELASTEVIVYVPADCNENGVDDRIDILGGFSSDTDEDGIPDECGGGPTCPWDCQAVPNGEVRTADLLALLGQWGGPGSCDFDGNGSVSTIDLLTLLGNWGPCP